MEKQNLTDANNYNKLINRAEELLNPTESRNEKIKEIVQSMNSTDLKASKPVQDRISEIANDLDNDLRKAINDAKNKLETEFKKL